MDNNPHKRPSEPITSGPTPFEQGEDAAHRFRGRVIQNPFKHDTDEAEAWQRGFDTTDRKIVERALAWFQLGCSAPHGYSFAPSHYGALITTMMQCNGQAMACVFAGAMLTHERRPAPSRENARSCFEAATYGATGRPLREDLRADPTVAGIHAAAQLMAEFVVAENKEAFEGGKATKISVDADRLFAFMINGPDKPAGQPAAASEGGGE